MTNEEENIHRKLLNVPRIRQGLILGCVVDIECTMTLLTFWKGKNSSQVLSLSGKTCTSQALSVVVLVKIPNVSCLDEVDCDD